MLPYFGGRKAIQLGQEQEPGTYPDVLTAAGASESYAEVPYYGVAYKACVAKGETFKNIWES